MSTSDNEDGLPAILKEAGSALSETVRSKWTRLLLKLVGVTTNAEAAQAISDRFDDMEARHIVKVEVAKEVAKRVTADEAMMQRAIDRMWSDEAAKQANLEGIAEKAIPLLEDGNVDHVHAEIDDDWRRRFADLAGSVSDEEMQGVWARILAGEFFQPGSFSLRTLRLVSELDKETADIFREFACNDMGGGAIYSPEGWSRGEMFEKAKALQSAGLLQDSPGGSMRFLGRTPDDLYVNRVGSWAVAFYVDPKLEAKRSILSGADDNLAISMALLTKAGRELLCLLDGADEERLVKEIAETLKEDRFVAAQLLKQGQDDEKWQIVDYLWGDEAEVERVKARN